MICEYCGKETDGTYGSGRFCSHLCQCRKNQRKCVEASIKSCKLKAQKDMNKYKMKNIYVKNVVNII